ncbi:MAG: AI-2E family transporter [Saccharofermentans sp.]|nr:AI-2E family transporter [Saccharofermentans sp.]
MNDHERYIKDRATVMSIIKYLLIAAVSALLIFFALRVVSVLIPFLIGFLLARTAHAIATPINQFKGRKHALSLKRKKRTEKIIYGFLVVIILLAAAYGIFSLIGQGMRALAALQSYAADFSDQGKLWDALQNVSESHGGIIKDSFIETIMANINQIQISIMEQIPDVLSRTVSSLWSIIGNIPYGIFVVISVFMSGFYFISDGPTVLKGYMKTIPNHTFRRSSIELINNLSVTLFRALGGYLLLLIITMLESWIAFKLADVDYALVLALVTAILDFLPVLGISATMWPVIIYCALHDNIRGAIIIIIAMAIMTVIRRFIEPAVLGKSLHLHPLMMLISMALGVYVWGAVGFLLGPVVFIILLDVFKSFGLDKKLQKFLSRVLTKFMNNDDDDNKNGENTVTAEEK